MRNFWLQVEHETACFEQDNGSTQKYVADDQFVIDYLASGGVLEEKFTPEMIEENNKKIDKQRIHNEMNTLLGDITMPEAMFLMLQYSMAKIEGKSNEPTPRSISISLTPTGEDLITWGDRIASELEAKIFELRGLS